jgi:hypothetical protein
VFILDGAVGHSDATRSWLDWKLGCFRKFPGNIAVKSGAIVTKDIAVELLTTNQSLTTAKSSKRFRLLSDKRMIRHQ